MLPAAEPPGFAPVAWKFVMNALSASSRFVPVLGVEPAVPQLTVSLLLFFAK